MEKVNKWVRKKNKEVSQSNFTFESLFKIIHSQENRIFCEYIDNFRVKKISYTYFNDYCYKTAKYLQKHITAPKGASVSLLMENSLNFLAVFWALLMLGYKPLLLNGKLPLSINQDVIRLAGSTFVVCDEVYQSYGLGTGQVILSSTGPLELIENEEMLTNPSWADEIALTTTATSLNVKICVYSGKNITSQITNSKYILNKNKTIKKHYKGSLKLLAFLPFYHIFGLVAVYFWFSVYGRTLVFLQNYSANTILKTVQKHEVTHIFAVPLLWQSVYKEIIKEVGLKGKKTQERFNKGVRLSLAIQNIFPRLGKRLAAHIFKEIQQKTFGRSVRFAISGGGSIGDECLSVINAIGYPLHNGYGATEIGITSVELGARPKSRIKGSVGKSFPSVEYKNEDGVLSVKGDSVCSKIITAAGTSVTEGSDWYNTKDIAFVDKKGRYFICGRLDDVVVGNNGEKINPDAIEKQLTVSGVSRYSVLGLDTGAGERLSLVLEIQKDTNDLNIIKILNDLDLNLARLTKEGYNIESIFYTFDQISNPNAIKVSRNYLKRKVKDGSITLHSLSKLSVVRDKDIAAISQSICDSVKNVMARILNRDIQEISDASHFIFELGGSSLDYCTLLLELKKVHDVDFDLKKENLTSAVEFSNYIVKVLK